METNKRTYGGRPSMPLEDRAKIFSPFDPLDGFREALRKKEREVEEQNRDTWERNEKS
ncbi:MAG: hypothetical protein IKF78_07695 [Atopobiaceae bacterium]|nr:hypothetical protein [Atopobiaceae bacterium]